MKIKKDFLSGLASILLTYGCSSNGEIEYETKNILEEPNRIVEKDYMVTRDELPIYKRGPVQVYSQDSILMIIPIKKREGSPLTELLKVAYPDYSSYIDSKTNQLITRIPIKDKEADLESYSKGLLSFIEGIDVSPALYRVQASSIRVSAVDLRAFRSSIDLFFETGNLNVALDSKFITERAKSGIAHTINILPFNNTQIDLFLNGLDRKGYVKDLSVTTLNAQNGESAEVAATQKVQVNKIIPQPNTSIIVPDFTDVKRSLKVTPISLENNRVYLKIEAQEGEVIPSGKELPNINTRTINTSIELILGQTVIIGSTLDSRARGEHEESPLLGDLASSTERERSKGYVIYFLTPERINLLNQSESRHVKSLEEDLNKEKR